LSVSTSNTLVLSRKFNETCIFGLWNRQGKIFGLQSKYSTRWIGQNLLGNLVCTATKFDRREEWDVSVSLEFSFPNELSKPNLTLCLQNLFARPMAMTGLVPLSFVCLQAGVPGGICRSTQLMKLSALEVKE
jgi:hypothetical protein